MNLKELLSEAKRANKAVGKAKAALRALENDGLVLSIKGVEIDADDVETVRTAMRSRLNVRLDEAQADLRALNVLVQAGTEDVEKKSTALSEDDSADTERKVAMVQMEQWLSANYSRRIVLKHVGEDGFRCAGAVTLCGDTYGDTLAGAITNALSV